MVWSVDMYRGQMPGFGEEKDEDGGARQEKKKDPKKQEVKNKYVPSCNKD